MSNPIKLTRGQLEDDNAWLHLHLKTVEARITLLEEVAEAAVEVVGKIHPCLLTELNGALRAANYLKDNEND